MIQKTINSFRYALRGLKTTWSEEHNFRTEVFATVLVVISIFYFDFTFVEAAILVLAVTLVLCAEIINTVVEDLCNKVEPSHDPIIAKIKDTSGAFVLVAVIGAVVAGVFVLLNHF
ncbi:MAG: diacylglycerol kinase family protein [Patescibacteria group bacterium]